MIPTFNSSELNGSLLTSAGLPKFGARQTEDMKVPSSIPGHSNFFLFLVIFQNLVTFYVSKKVSRLRLFHYNFVQSLLIEYFYTVFSCFFFYLFSFLSIFQINVFLNSRGKHRKLCEKITLFKKKKSNRKLFCL